MDDPAEGSRKADMAYLAYPFAIALLTFGGMLQFV
jgi:hypothetical protein